MVRRVHVAPTWCDGSTGPRVESGTVPGGSFHLNKSEVPPASSLFFPRSSPAASYLFLARSRVLRLHLCSSALRLQQQGLEASVAAADKMSAIVMRVDLDCEKCYKKIRKVLCKIQDKVSIRTITYDEKSKTVTISGPFDAEEVADRLTSNAGKVITDMHVVGGGNQKHVFNAPTKPGKVDGHGHGHGHGGKKEKGHGGFGGGGGGNKQEKGHGGYGGGKQEIKGHGGGKPDKKHVKFDVDDMSDDDDDLDDEPAGRHAHHGGHGNGGKPKIVTTTTPVAARLDAPRTGPSMSMATAAPMRMPGMAPQPQPQAMAVPSIWPAPSAAPEWGYSAPQYGGYPAGGYYGVPATYGQGGYGAPAYGHGRNPYGAPSQYYEEEPSAGCSIM